MKDHQDIACAIVETIRPLTNPDNCSAFISAWEMDGYNMSIDGEDIMERLRSLMTQYDVAKSENRADRIRESSG